MSFETDKQTLDDLNILGKYKNNSVYSLFNGVVTRGGERLLEDMFLHPLTDVGEINRRVGMFRYFKEHALTFPGESEECDVMEQYISGASGKHWIFNLLHLGQAKFLEVVGHDPRYEVWQEQVVTTIDLLGRIRAYLHDVVKDMKDHPLEERIRNGIVLLDTPALNRVLVKANRKLGLKDMFLYDRLFRYTW